MKTRSTLNTPETKPASFAQPKPSAPALEAARDIARAYSLGHPPRDLIAAIVDNFMRFPQLTALAGATAALVAVLELEPDGQGGMRAIPLPAARSAVPIKNLAHALQALTERGVDFRPEVMAIIQQLTATNAFST